MGSLGISYAAWTDTLTIDTTVNTGSWEQSGSAGGWWKHACCHHNSPYTEDEILDFLAAIDSASDWLVPDMDGDGEITTSDMHAILTPGEGATMEQKFLRHYLATRLNVEAGRLFLDTFHLFSILDPPTIDYPDGYLGLEGEHTLEWIINAIEGKYGTSPTEAQFEIMKDICDALNNLTI